MQVKVHLRSRLRLKLIVTASQMISQGHITAQCVTNGLQQNNIWPDTEKCILEGYHMPVLSVRKRFHVRAACTITWIFIQVNTDVQYVANAVETLMICQCTNRVIHKRNCLNCLNAMFAASNFQRKVALLYTAEFTLERNHTNVTCVTKHLVSLRM